MGKKKTKKPKTKSELTLIDAINTCRSDFTELGFGEQSVETYFDNGTHMIVLTFQKDLTDKKANEMYL